MAFGKIKKMFAPEEEIIETDVNDDYYTNTDITTSGKMILLEPRAYSESQQIADYLRRRNTVVVNMKRVTSAQAMRIIDFLSGTVYAIGGDLQKIGNGIYLCTPNNIDVEGKISEEEGKASNKNNNNDEIDW